MGDASMNAETIVQSGSCVRILSLGRPFLCRALLVGIVVCMTHQFAWWELKNVTSETVLRLSEFLGLSAQRVSADTIGVQGNLFRFDISCTFVDVVMGMIPLAWAFHRTVVGNLLTIIPLAVGLFGFNIFRLEVGQLLFARGAPWVLADQALGGIAYFAVWTLIVNRFSKYWRQPCN